MKKISLVLISILFFASCKNEKVNLELNLEKGKTYYQEMNSKVVSIQEMNGQEINVTMLINGKMSYLVQEVLDSVYQLEVKYENLSMDMQFPQGSMKFSSEKDDPNDIISQVLSAMRNASFTVSMTKKGKIISVKNIDALFETLSTQFPELPEMQREQFKSLLLESYGEESFKGNMEMVTAIFPDHPVEKNDQWTIVTDLKSGFSARVTTTFTFMGTQSGNHKIHGESILSTEDTTHFSKTGGMEIQYNLKGNMVSDLKVDKNSGWIVEGKISQDIQGQSTIKPNEQLPNGMTTPVVIKNEMVVSGK